MLAEAFDMPTVVAEDDSKVMVEQSPSGDDLALPDIAIAPSAVAVHEQGVFSVYPEDRGIFSKILIRMAYSPLRLLSQTLPWMK